MINNTLLFNNFNKNQLKYNEKIHIRINQRTTHKTITIIENIPPDLDIKKIFKYLKKNFKCNGKAFKSENLNYIIQLQGDHRINVKDFLIDMNICNSNNIIIHGF